MRFYRALAAVVVKGRFLEIAVVLVVLGVASTMIGPRMSRGAARAPDLDDNVLAGRCAELRGAIAAYAADHAGRVPGGSDIERQLLGHTDPAGVVGPERSVRFRHGPYLREIPGLPVGAEKGSTGIATAPAPGVGWVYDAATGRVRPNTTAAEVDIEGRAYAAY